MHIHGCKQTPATPPTSSDEDSSGSSSDASAKRKKGNRAMGKKKYPKAIRYYTKAIKLDAENPSYVLNRAIANAALELWKDCEHDATQAVEFGGSSASAKGHFQLARARFRRGRLSEARAACAKGLAVYPDELALQQLQKEISREVAKRAAREKREAEEAARKPVPPEGPGSAQRLIETAQAMLAAGKAAEAVPLLKEARESAAARAESCAEDAKYQQTAASMLGKAYMMQRQWHEAADAYAENAALKAASLKLDSLENREAVSSAYNNLGIALKNAGKLREGVDALKKAYTTATNGDDQVATAQSAQILQNTGQCLRQEGKHGEARRFYERALEIGLRLYGPDHASNALNHLCVARCRRDKGDFKEAIQSYTKSCEIWMHKDPEECLKELPDVPNKERLASLQQQCKSELGQLVMLMEQARQGSAPEAEPIPSVTAAFS